MSVKQISIFMENKPGALLAMTTVLAENRIDMRAFTLAETSDFGIVRIIVDDVYEATTVLKEAGYVHTLTPVVVIAIPDEPGGLNKVLKDIYVYTIIVGLVALLASVVIVSNLSRRLVKPLVSMKNSATSPSSVMMASV